MPPSPFPQQPLEPGQEQRSFSLTCLFILCVCACVEEVVCGFIFLRLWSVVYGFSSYPSLPMSTSKKRGDFSEKEREIPWNGRAVAASCGP